MVHTYRPRGVCSQLMRVEIENGIVKQVEVKGGCDGNLQGISRLIVGMDARISSQKRYGNVSKKRQIDLHNIDKIIKG